VLELIKDIFRVFWLNLSVASVIGQLSLIRVLTFSLSWWLLNRLSKVEDGVGHGGNFLRQDDINHFPV